jgi:predicted GIY-YIG superfamily endonuclease
MRVPIWWQTVSLIKHCARRVGEIDRENQIKGMLKNKKIALIKSMNPNWRDLSAECFDENTRG